MGTEVPPESPELEDAKWYCCIVDNYIDEGFILGCDGTYVGQTSCCKTGADITAWLDAGKECVNILGLCPPEIGNAQRLIAIHGPHDTEGQCNANCPP